MIISHRHRFIFFAVPKTATHAIRQALTPVLGEDDWQQQALFGEDRLPIPELAAIGHGHLSARDVLPYLPATIWQTFHKFAFVRNPFDRFVSTCFFLFRSDARFAKDATSNMKAALQRPKFRGRVLVAPQLSFLTGTDGEQTMDHIGRFEDLQGSFDDICKNIGITAASLQTKNPSKHGHYADYYDQELAEMIVDFYRDDFRAFGYPSELAELVK